MQLEQLVQEALATLDDEHRIVIVLRDIEELSYKEICDVTGLVEGTVKSRLHRARLALRQKIQKHM
jgi:RNA polymerase sigma-70 factor (ECF subfamily)